MNNPEDVPVSPEEMQKWLRKHKLATSMSWAALAKESGIPSGTLSLFQQGNYAGNNVNVAKSVFKYKQFVESQAELAVGLPQEPDYIETVSAARFRSLMMLAHRGRITMIAAGPGTGKTITMNEYAASVSNVWKVTIAPTTRTLGAMITEVMRAMEIDLRSGWSRQMSNAIKNHVTGRAGLIIVDEANHLELEAHEELRAWHDLTGVGIVLLGNEELWQRVRGTGRGHAYARLNSRIAMAHLQDLPLEQDVEMFLDAWGIEEAKQRKLLTAIGMSPGQGGLREVKQIIENAAMLAQDEQRPLTLDDLNEAKSSRTSRWIRVTA